MANSLRLEEAAEYLKMGKSVVYKFASQGRFPAHKAANVWRLDQSELDDRLKSGKLGNPAGTRNSEGANQA